MCTITYLPIKDGYILTQNRDESPNREEAIFPVREPRSGQAIIYPRDPEGSGSWFVSTAKGITICIMNGVYHAQKKDGQFKHSRGLIPLHYLAFEGVEDFINNYHYRELEGFTLLICSPKGVDSLHWDEVKLQHDFHAADNLIFQSNPLYNPSQKAFRKGLFDDFLGKHEKEQILDFHTKPQTDDSAINILMDRKVVKSVSTIQRTFFEGENSVGYLTLGASAIQKANFD